MSFWGDDIDCEISPFDKIAHTSGFYTFGEYIRIGKKIYIHNATLISIGMRENAPVGIPVMALPRLAQKKMSGEISMVERLVSFIQATTGELERLNKNLAQKALTVCFSALTDIFGQMEGLIVFDIYLVICC